jgi:deoxyribodipyrimidine photo-lyase
MPPVILWFRRNLRLRDNAAVIEAALRDQPVVPVYVVGPDDAGGASRWWLHHSLESLDGALRDLGGGLVVRSGDPVDRIAAIADATGASEILFARRFEPAARADEKRLAERLGDELTVTAVDDALLNQPRSVMTQGETPYRVFTPYWRAAARLGEPAAPEPAVPGLRMARHDLESTPLGDLDLLPTAPDWAGGLRQTWTPGEEGALARLDELPDTAARYATERDRPDLDGTSRLSPHLHFGEVSVRQVWSAVRSAEARGMNAASAEALLRQLYWRDFSHYLLFHFPGLPEAPLREEFRRFPWIDDPDLLEAWQRGRTGYPIVDAGMRQLWHTGWMHNRVRMIVASFLVKDLLIPWQRGAAWFLDTLVDADLANNSASWQWVAGCGTDAAPYFRIFNPTLQGEKFDPRGDYVRRWVPELASGGDYAEPVVDHASARDRALEAYRTIR